MMTFASVLLAVLRLVPCGPDGFVLERDGRVIVSAIRPSLGGSVEPQAEEREVVTNRNGDVVYNAWSRQADCRWRFEAAVRKDGAVELTMAGDIGPFDQTRSRLLEMDLPDAVWKGVPYRALSGNCRDWREASGSLGSGTNPEPCHWLAAGGLIFDFCPQGAGEYYASYGYGASAGVWQSKTAEGCVRLSGGGTVPPYGGYAGTKVIIREGSFDDYDQIHFLRLYHYRHLPQTCVYDVVGATNELGAAYAVRAGNGKWMRTYDKLRDGYYILNVHASNPEGKKNRFSLTANGEVFARDVSVPAKKMRMLARAIKVTGGRLRIEASGSYLVSLVALQPILSCAEDFSIGRGWWLRDGYEPGTFFRNCDFAKPAVFPLRDECVDLPVSGREGAKLHAETPPEVCLPDPKSPELAWLKTAKIHRLMSNQCTLAEFDRPGDLARYFETAIKGKNVVMLSGMHSRHTYVGHLDRGVEAIRRICAEAHRRGIKVFDHHDATLLWNICGGFRVMMERLPEVMRDKDRHLPCFSFCPNNRVFKETYRTYLRRLVEAGVDGFQIDELEFWGHGCSCADCRTLFREETGGELPLVTARNPLNDKSSELYRRWYYWRQRKVTDWFIDLRKSVEDLNPNLVLNMYITHDGFYVSGTRRNSSWDLIDLGRTVNFFGTEVMTRSPLASARALPPLRKMKASLSHAYGTPLWAWWYASNRPSDYFAWAVSALNGEVALLGNFTPDPNLGDYVGFGDSPAAMRVGTAHTMAKLALVFSESTRDWGDAKKFYLNLLGLAQELEALHVPYDIICERSLNERGLAKYSALALGAADKLPEDCRQAIAAWQARGGQLIDTPPAEDFFVEEAMLGWKLPPDFYKSVGTPKEKEFRKTVRELVKPYEVWRTDAPDKVYTALWENDEGQVFVHFLNATAKPPTPGTTVTTSVPGEPFPRVGRDIVFAFPFPIKSAKAVSPDFTGEIELPVQRVGKTISKVVLDEMVFKIYTLVRIERE